jgi:hypothetical protein
VLHLCKARCEIRKKAMATMSFDFEAQDKCRPFDTAQ